MLFPEEEIYQFPIHFIKVRSTWSFFYNDLIPWFNVCIVCSMLLLNDSSTEVHAALKYIGDGLYS